MATSRPPTITNPTEQAGNRLEGETFAHEAVDVFGDEFAEDYAESIRTLEVINENPFLDDTATPLETPLDEDDNEITNRPLLPETHARTGRNSTRKSGHAEEIGIREVGRRLEDGTHAPIPEAQRLMSSARSNRTLSTSSNFSFAPSRSSTGQPPGPSHAYGLYPQGLGIDRTESIASTSTSHPSRDSVRRGPLHPYSLYQQNVTHSIGTGSAATSLRAPRSEPDETAQRRAHGDQDSLRPDDHSEQLPAYTRYPDEMHTKIAAGPPLTPTSHRSMASEMEERTRFGPYAYGVATGVPAAVYTQTPNEAPDAYAGREKKEHASKRSRFLGATLCGSIPLWTICLAVAVVALIAIICGGAIGSFASKKHLQPLVAPNSTSTTTAAYSDVIATSTISTTQYIDASPISTPSSLPPLPTGSFQLSFQYPASSANSSACLVNSAQQVAWSCELEMVAPWELQIQQTSAGDMISIDGSIDTAELYYGTQPPPLDNELLALVVDLDNETLGPAYHFQTHYNKLVILPGDASIGSTPVHDNNKRAVDVASEFHKKSIPEADSPWFCWFNETLIEGFVYVSQLAHTTSSASLTTSTAVYSETSSTPASATTATTTSQQLSSAASTVADAPRPTSWPDRPSSHGPLGWMAQSTSCTSLPPGAAGPTGTYSHPSWPPPKVRRQESSTVPAPPTSMPLLFRIEERRAGAVMPAVCTQMASVEGVYAPILNNGVPTTINLTETDPTPSYVPPQARKRDNDQDTCFCMWRS